MEAGPKRVFSAAAAVSAAPAAEDGHATVIEVVGMAKGLSDRHALQRTRVASLARMINKWAHADV